MHDYHQHELPKLFALAAEGGLLADYEIQPLEQVEQAWQAKTAPGSRIVISV